MEDRRLVPNASHGLESDSRFVELFLHVEANSLELIRNRFTLPENRICMSLTPRSDRCLKRLFIARSVGNSHHVDRLILI